MTMFENSENILACSAVIGLCAFLLTLLAVPLCKKLAYRIGCIDVPKAEAHKQHGRTTPLLGGLAMACGWILTVLGGCLAFSTISFADQGTVRSVVSVLPELLVLTACAAAAAVLGLIDDRKPMKAHTKFAGQFVIALIAVIFGNLRISLFIPSEIFSCVVTLLWLLFLFNAINFFDNMDGLAVGTATIAFLMFFIAAMVNGQYFVALLCACSFGTGAAFWLFNRYPASMFMGDAGSHFLAFLLGVISVKVTYYNPEIASSRFAVLIPLFILALPVFDAFAVVLIRLRNHKPIYVGDNNHISHRFLKMGFSRAQSVLLVHLLCLFIGLGALPILWGDWKTCVILFAQGVVFLTVLSIMQCVSAAHES